MPKLTLGPGPIAGHPMTGVSNHVKLGVRIEKLDIGKRHIGFIAKSKSAIYFRSTQIYLRMGIKLFTYSKEAALARRSTFFSEN